MEDKQPFNRAIKLLHSKQEDSEVQLLQLVDELILKKYGKGKSVMKVFKEKPHLFSKDHVPSFLKGEDKPPDSDSSEAPLYLDHTSNSPGVISIPDDPSSSLLALEQDFEASISSMDIALPLLEVRPPPMEVDVEAGTVPTKSHKAGGGRKKKSTKTGGSKEPANVLDEVMALMDKGVDKNLVGSVSSQQSDLCEGQTQVPCLLCTDGKMAKAVACRRCKQTFLVCCIEISASTFDPENWSCSLCAMIRKRGTIPSFGVKGSSVDRQLRSPPSSSRTVTADAGRDSKDNQTRKNEGWRKIQNSSASSAKPKGDQPSVYRSTRSRKTLNFEKKLQNIKTPK